MEELGAARASRSFRKTGMFSELLGSCKGKGNPSFAIWGGAECGTEQLSTHTHFSGLYISAEHLSRLHELPIRSCFSMQGATSPGKGLFQAVLRAWLSASVSEVPLSINHCPVECMS